MKRTEKIGKNPETLQIWGENNISLPPVEEKEPKAFSRQRTPWGFRHVLYALFFMVLSQIPATMILIAVAYSQLPPIGEGFSYQDLSVALPEKTFEIIYQPIPLISIQLLTYGSWLLAMWLATRFNGARSFKKDFLLSFKKRDILYGLGFAAAVIGFQLGLFALIELLFPNFDLSATNNTGFLEVQEGAWLWIVGIGIVGLAGPFFEELFFRGLILQGLIRTLGKWFAKIAVPASVVLSSVIFGLFHTQGSLAEPANLIIVGVTGLIGFGLALMTVKTKRLGPAIMGHIFFNTSSVLLSIWGLA